MRQSILILVCVVNTLSLWCQERVQFKLQFSEPYATYDFLAKISDNYPDNDLKSIFSKSKYNTDQYRKLISDFEQLPIDYSYSYKQYPQPLKVGVMTRDVLEKNLAISQTVTEFRTKSVGIIPNEDLSQFSVILETFQPIYHELILVPNKAALEMQKNNLLHYIKTNQFADFFQIGLSFYHTQWDKNIPFEINLLPSLDKENLGARAFINVAVCEASLDLKDHISFFSVAMHEIYHIVYDNQSLAMKRDVQQWFNDTKSPNSQYALLLLNEVLATAIGNGYVIEKLTGKTEEQEWYGNTYISGMAKEIYPTLKRYIESQKTMDESFVKIYVNLYDSKFPHWDKELSHIFAYRYIVADTPTDWQYLRRTFRYYSINRLGSPMTASEVEKTKNMPITKVFVISENHEEKINLLKSNFDEIKNKAMDYNKEFIEVFNLEDHTKLLIINRHNATVEELMNNYFPNKMMK